MSKRRKNNLWLWATLAGVGFWFYKKKQDEAAAAIAAAAIAQAANSGSNLPTSGSV